VTGPHIQEAKSGLTLLVKVCRWRWFATQCENGFTGSTEIALDLAGNPSLTEASLTEASTTNRTGVTLASVPKALGGER
jgi:hypothetical protein